METLIEEVEILAQEKAAEESDARTVAENEQTLPPNSHANASTASSIREIPVLPNKR
jgi:hypothetical protein